MIKTKVAVLDGRLFSSQSELFKNFSNRSDWLDKSRTGFEKFEKSHFCFDHVNRLIQTYRFEGLSLLLLNSCSLRKFS